MSDFSDDARAAYEAGLVDEATGSAANPATFANGLHSQITRAEYDAIDRLNLSRLKLMGRSPAHFKAWVNKDTKSKTTGRIVHMAVFEPHRLETDTAIYSERRQGKKWEAFEEANAGKEILTLADFDSAIACAASVRSDPYAAKYLAGEGTAESTLLWDYMGHACKCRLDWLGNAVVELKSTRDASEMAFVKQASSLNYHVQGGWQVDGVEFATGERKRFVIIAVEPEPPYPVVVYPVPERLIEIGRQTYRGWVERLTDCAARGRWPAYVDGEVELTLPKWAEQEIA